MIPEFRIVTNGALFSVEYKQNVEHANLGKCWVWHYISHCAEFPYSQSSARRTFDSKDAAQKWIDDWREKVEKMQKPKIWTPV